LQKITFSELRNRVILRQRRKMSVFNRVMLWLHYLLVVSLLISVSAKYISPVLFWLPAFFGLAFPYLFALNLLFFVYWMAQFKPVAIFSIIIMVISIPTAYRYVHFTLSSAGTQSRSLKVTSYNCMLFDLYNWSQNRERRSKILTSLSEINPDILCLQEFYTSEQPGHFNNIDTVREKLRMNNHHCEFTTTLRGKDHWGIGTFSKFPIINKGKIIFHTRSNNICIFTDIVVNSDTIRVYNVHLQSISFSRQDNKFFDDVISEKDAEDEMTNSKNILRRLKRAFVKRAQQVEMIYAHMKTCRYKMVLCGDFNDTGASYSYEKLSRNLYDAFLERGSGIGRTYAGKWPQFRIDYILHSKELRCGDYKRSPETITDHYPITAYFDNVNWK
jgi:endonuclease/exonuclease/phosphatase family metal-dependent hydrolase